jgi:hypothetical protein
LDLELLSLFTRRRRKSLQIGAFSANYAVCVFGFALRSVRRGRNAAYQDVFDFVTIEYTNQSRQIKVGALTH